MKEKGYAVAAAAAKGKERRIQINDQSPNKPCKQKLGDMQVGVR